MKKICLVIPGSIFLSDERVFPHLGILRIGAVLERAGYSVDALDLSGIKNPLSVLSCYVEQHSKMSCANIIFAITSTTPQMPQTSEICKHLKAIAPEARIVLGGPHVTAIAAGRIKEKERGHDGRAVAAFEKLRSLADVLVAGDGEESIFVAIADNAPPFINGDNRESRFFIGKEEFSSLPLPARHLIDLDSYHYYINGKRAGSVIWMQGCPFQCVADDVAIGVASGLMYPDEIQRNRVEICPEGHIHTLGTFQGGEIVSNGVKSTVEITLKNNLRVKVTPDHPILVAHKERLEWKPAGKLQEGDWVALAANQNRIEELYPLQPPKLNTAYDNQRKVVSYPAFLDENVAWLTGLLIADGSLSSDKRPATHFAVKPRVRNMLEVCLERCFGIAPKLVPFANTTKLQQTWIYSRTIREFFEQSVGVNRENKLRVPYSIRRSPRRIVRAFLDGLFAGDGYFGGNGHPYVSTVSHEFAQELAQLALWCGWGASINYSAPDSKGHRHARIRICKDECWERKEEGNPCLTASVPLDARKIYRSSKSGKLHWRTATNHNPGALRTTLRELDPQHPLIQGQYIYCQVRKVEESGKRRVFDISVPSIEQFGAGGIAVHNCSYCSLRASPSFRIARSRTPDNIIEEVKVLVEDYGYRGIQIYDDEINVSSQHLENNLRALIAYQERTGIDLFLRGFVKANLLTDAQVSLMKEAGFHEICVGVESAHPRILENINKKATVEQNAKCVELAKKYGIRLKAFTSIGHPGESPESIEALQKWLVAMEVDDFDCTVISPFPSVPYFDDAVQTAPRIWTYTSPKSGDHLHAIEVDYTTENQYFKGNPELGYRSHVYTDYLSPEDIVQGRDWIENSVRSALKIPYYQSKAAEMYDHSYGAIPPNILRSSEVR